MSNVNQSYKKKINFYKTNDNHKKVSISINLSGNHDIKKDMLDSIEKYMSDLFLSEYIDDAKFKLNKENERELEQSEKLMMKDNRKLEAYKKRIGLTEF